MRGAFSGYRAAGGGAAAALSLASPEIDEGAAAGTVVGVVSKPSSAWRLVLAEDGGGVFALSGDTLIRGAVAPNRTADPAPAVLVAATDGVQATAARIEIRVRRALPALPLPSGARIAAIGDSLVGYNNYGGVPLSSAARAADSFGYGPIEQAFASDPRFSFDSWYDPADPLGRNLSGANQGVFADHLDWNDPALPDILGRLPAVLARRPQMLVLQGGTNSINSGDTSGQQVPASAALVVARLDQALAVARLEGIPVILCTLYPRCDWPAGDARHATLAEANAWIRAQAGRTGVVGIFDPTETLAPGGVLDARLYAGDLVHLNPRGAAIVGQDHLLPLIRSAVAPGTVFDSDPAVTNCLTAAQGKMQGTSGSRTGTTVTPTGAVAAGYSAVAGRSVAALACSKETVSGDIEAQVFDVTPGDLSAPAYGTVLLTLPLSVLPSPAAGKWYRTALQIETSGPDTVGTARLLANLRTAGSGTNHTTAIALNTFSGDFAPALRGPRTWWIATKPMQAPAGVVCDRLNATLEIYFAKTAGPFRVKVSRAIVREVPDPRPAWGY